MHIALNSFDEHGDALAAADAGGADGALQAFASGEEGDTVGIYTYYVLCLKQSFERDAGVFAFFAL